MRTHNCGMGFQCQNTDGSFTCNLKQRCLTGFTQDSHSNCIDIDECSSVSEPCTTGFNCINTVGSYTCQRKIIMCSRGYHSSPDGARCIDVDECQMGTHRCGEGQICHNLPGSYRCDCQTGYQYDAIRQLCVDVNECWRYPGRLCAQACDNTPGSYQCSCTTGFSLAFDGKNCEDVSECDNNPCSQECANIYGSYQCYCRMGYYLKEDGHTCEDIDECSQSIGNLCAFQCVNVPGSYKCACPPHGYSMSSNGRTCQDIDECAIGSHNCSASQTCFNIQGGFRCLSFACPDNYRRVKLPQLPAMPDHAITDHVLPVELPDQHRHPSSDLPHRTLHPARKRGRLLQHTEAQQLNRRRVPAPTGAGATGLPYRRGDEAAASRNFHNFPGPHLRVHHTLGANIPFWKCLTHIHEECVSSKAALRMFSLLYVFSYVCTS
uniref:Fibulin 2 n=1 Tax=Sinocyclocheilus anshuiensis TaxID=1608454 RepID=A0A671TE03_9TELE